VGNELRTAARPARRIRRAGLVLVLATALVATLGYQAYARLAAPARAAAAPTAFVVKTAAVQGLYPGAQRAITVRVTNPFSHAFVVRKVSARVLAATSAAGCRGSSANLRVTGYRGRPFTLHARGSKNISMAVSMPGTVADAYQGATFHIRFGGTAVRP